MAHCVKKLVGRPNNLSLTPGTRVKLEIENPIPPTSCPLTAVLAP